MGLKKGNFPLADIESLEKVILERERSIPQKQLTRLYCNEKEKTEGPCGYSVPLKGKKTTKLTEGARAEEGCIKSG